VGWQHLALGRPLPGHFGTKGQLATALETSVLEDVPLYLGYLSAAAYAFVTLRHYRAYRRYLNDNFSDTEQLRFAWLRPVLLAIPLGLGVAVLFELTNDTVRPLSYYQAWYDYFFTGLLIYYLSIAGLLAGQRLPAALHFQPEPAEAEPEAAAPSATAASAAAPSAAEPVAPEPVAAPAPPAEAAAADPELQRWTGKLRAHMAAARPYLAPELTLGELAAQLHTNTSLLSRVINTGCGQNFNDFVNEYRVQAAEQQLRDPKFRHYTLLAVALESGFNSKSTFNRVFRKLRGQTPSEAAGRNV
jgi:AraC-like DNA-binding protein